MQLLRNFFKKIAYLFSNGKASIICPLCKSKNITKSEYISNTDHNFHTKEYVIKCKSCNRVGIHKEVWSKIQTKKSILTDIEVEVDN